MKSDIFKRILAVVGMGLVISPLISKAGSQDHWYSTGTWSGPDWTDTYPRGMALGTNGLIYVVLQGANADEGKVRVVETNGSIVTNWTGFNGPWDVAISTNGLVYVGDAGNNLIKVFDHAGNAVTSWGGSGTNAGEFNGLRTVSILPSGNIVVADSGNSRIQIFDPMGGFIRQWGEVGLFDGQFHPGGIESDVGPDGLIYVNEKGYDVSTLNRANARIQVFEESGTYKTKYFEGTSQTLEPFLSCGLNEWFFYDGMNHSGARGLYAHGNESGQMRLQQMSGGYVVGHALELPDGTLLVSNGSIFVWKRYYRQFAYDPAASNDVPVPVVIRAEQRPGTTWMDIDYVVHDGDDENVAVAALAFVDGGTNYDSVVKISTLAEDTGSNLGAGLAAGVEHHLTWNVAADWSTNYANVQIEILARDGRDLMDFQFIAIPETGTNAAVTLNKSMIGEDDFRQVWMWLVATGDPNIALVSGKVVGQLAPYAGLDLTSGTETTASGRAFLFDRFNVVEASAAEKQWAVEARAIAGTESTYWVKPKP